MPDTATPLHANGTVVSSGKRPRMKSESDFTNGNTDFKDLNGHTKTSDNINGTKRRKNQFGEESDGIMSLSDWVKQWDNGKTKFHKPTVHPMLKKHVDRLVEGKNKPRFFLPLCGKSVDLKWLLDRGYSVVGCEIAELGIQQFFQEHNIKYTTEQITGMEGTIYKGTDHDITIYSCDFFKLNNALIGEVDCIWDRGAMAAINPEDRQKYSKVIQSLMKPDSRYLLDMFQLEHHTFAGPPHNFDPEEAHELYATKYNIEQIEHVDALSPWQQTWGTSYFFENDFFITPKNE